jgi:hypothetical protein
MISKGETIEDLFVLERRSKMVSYHARPYIPNHTTLGFKKGQVSVSKAERSRCRRYMIDRYSCINIL